MKHSIDWTIELRSSVRNFYFAAALGLLILAPETAVADGTEVHITAPTTTSEEAAPPEQGDAGDLGTSQPMVAPSPELSSHEDSSPHAHSDDMEGALDEHDEMEAHQAEGDRMEGASDDQNAMTAEAHDHASHAPSNELLETAFGRLLFWLGKLHPAAVHFPIAMLLGAAVAELASLRFQPDFFHNAARYSLWIGTLGAVGAAFLGWFYGGFRLVDEENIMTLHRWNGTSIALVSIAALWLAERRITHPARSAAPYRTVLFVVALMAGLNGYWGGVMVYGPEQHQWPQAPATHGH